MGTAIILGIVIVSPVVFSAAALRWASEEWLRAFVLIGALPGEADVNRAGETGFCRLANCSRMGAGECSHLLAFPCFSNLA